MLGVTAGRLSSTHAAGGAAFHAVFPLSMSGRFLGILIGMDQKDSLLPLRPRSSPTAAVACFLMVLLVDAVRAVFPSLSAGSPAGSGMGSFGASGGSCFTCSAEMVFLSTRSLFSGFHVAHCS